MKHLLSTLCLFLFFSHSQAQTIKKILFLGNSYTYQNNLPGMLTQLSSSLGDSAETSASTQGGQRLRGHATNSGTYTLFNSKNWDYIVMQEQSQLPSFPAAQVQTDVFPYAKQLCDSIHAMNKCTKPVFFMTWGRENGDLQNCQFYPPLCTYEGMQGELRKNYVQMANDNNAWVSPVGMVWREVRKQVPALKLYTADGSHPSYAGSYVAACTFYTMLYGKSPKGASYIGTLSQTDADSIQSIATRIVFDSLANWNATPPNLSPNFTFSASHDTVSFSYTGAGVDNYEWHFGDGNISTTKNPIHIYGSSNNYQVTLIVVKGCDTDTIVKSVSVTTAQASVTCDFRASVSFDTVSLGYLGSIADSVRWLLGNGSIDTGMAVSHVYGVVGNFDVTAIAYYKSAVDSLTKTITTTLQSTSIVSIREKAQVVAAPNPFKDNISITSNFEFNGVRLYNLAGKIVFEQFFDTVHKQKEVDLPNLESGVYLLEVTGDMKVYRTKVFAVGQ